MTKRELEEFKNILVAIDLSQGSRLVCTDLPPPTEAAVERALWIAKSNSARLTFFYALDVSAAAQRLIEESEGGSETVLDQAQGALDVLVQRAAAQATEAKIEVRFGRSWLEIIRQVLRGDHDLVVAGTCHQGVIAGVLMGSTGIKLLRKCPCPVWITQPSDQQIKSILVAHCLQTVGDMAMERACRIAVLQDSELHVLHSLRPDVDSCALESATPERIDQLRRRAEEHIEAQLAHHKFAKPPQIHIVMEPPAEAVLEKLAELQIQLLVMGTVGRTGIAGLITGNTAERLLPRLPCSVLALKPPGFVSPISL